MLTKTELRARMLAARRSRGSEEIVERSVSIERRLRGIQALEAAQCWLVYVSVAGEVATGTLIRDLLAHQKRILIPHLLDSTRMTTRSLRAWTDLRPGWLGIPTTADQPSEPMEPDVCIMPGLAFTISGQRLGFGKGHWDRFLAGVSTKLRVGLCFEDQIVPEIPMDATDQAVDLVVTEARLIWSRQPSAGA